MPCSVQVDVTGLTDNIVEINLGCGIRDNQHKHRVYTNTYLGYGTNEARSKYYKSVVEQHIADRYIPRLSSRLRPD